MNTRALFACTLLLTACDRGAKDPPVVEAAPAGPVAPVGPVEAAKATGPVAAAAVAPAAPVKRLSAQERASAGFDAAAAKGEAATFRAQLAAGRKAVKAKDYASGISALEAALKVDPNHAAALAELGWAEYLAGNLERAQRHTERAIASGGADRTRGAALYNLGRILEDRGEKDAAATAYQRSLALRPHAVVQTRLASLTADGAETGGHECDFEKTRQERPPEDLCAALIGTWRPDEVFSGFACFEGDTEPGEVAVDAAGTMAGGEPRTKIDAELAGGIRVAHFTVSHMMESGGAEDVTYVAVLYADRWSYAALATAYNPGVGYIGESVEVRSVEVKDVVPGGRPEVVVTLTHDRHDGDYGINSTENDSSRQVAVLSVEGEAPRWLGAFAVSVVAETMTMIEGEPSDVVPSRKERQTGLSFETATGEVVLAAVPGFEPASAVGRFKLGEVAAACPAGLNFMAGG